MFSGDTTLHNEMGRLQRKLKIEKIKQAEEKIKQAAKQAERMRKLTWVLQVFPALVTSNTLPKDICLDLTFFVLKDDILIALNQIMASWTGDTTITPVSITQRFVTNMHNKFVLDMITPKIISFDYDISKKSSIDAEIEYYLNKYNAIFNSAQQIYRKKYLSTRANQLYFESFNFNKVEIEETTIEEIKKELPEKDQTFFKAIQTLTTSAFSIFADNKNYVPSIKVTLSDDEYKYTPTETIEETSKKKVEGINRVINPVYNDTVFKL